MRPNVVWRFYFSGSSFLLERLLHRPSLSTARHGTASRWFAAMGACCAVGCDVFDESRMTRADGALATSYHMQGVSSMYTLRPPACVWMCGWMERS